VTNEYFRGKSITIVSGIKPNVCPSDYDTQETLIGKFGDLVSQSSPLTLHCAPLPTPCSFCRFYRRFCLPFLVAFWQSKNPRATLSPDQNASRYLTNQGVEELRNRGTSFHCSTEDKFGRAEFRPVSAHLSPVSAENGIKSISDISGLLDYNLHLPCIYRDGRYLAVKSVSWAQPFRLFENCLKYASFPMIEETLFREGEAVF